MLIAVKRLLDVSYGAACQVMGSTKISANADTWIQIVRERHPLPDAKSWAEYGFTQVSVLAKGRNDFVHALYGLDASQLAQGESAPVLIMPRTSRDAAGLISLNPAIKPAASRVKGRSIRPLAELSRVCEQAAHLSVITAFVAETCNPSTASLATWRRRLGSRLPPQASSAAPPPAKGRRSPPRSSRA